MDFKAEFGGEDLLFYGECGGTWQKQPGCHSEGLAQKDPHPQITSLLELLGTAPILELLPISSPTTCSDLRHRSSTSCCWLCQRGRNPWHECQIHFYSQLESAAVHQWITSTTVPLLTLSLAPSSPSRNLAAARDSWRWKDLCECEKEWESLGDIWSRKWCTARKCRPGERREKIKQCWDVSKGEQGTEICAVRSWTLSALASRMLLCSWDRS